MPADYVAVNFSGNNGKQESEDSDSDDDADETDRRTLLPIAHSLTVASHQYGPIPRDETEQAEENIPDITEPVRHLPWFVCILDKSLAYTEAGATRDIPDVAIPLSTLSRGQARNLFDADPADKSTLSVVKIILYFSWINVLLVFVPMGIAASVFRLSPILIFIFNVIAIIPLSSLLTMATENLAYDLGDTIGALLNVSFGNVSEIIILIALAENQIRIVQASLIGSILVNLLLILGTAILVGGIKYREQTYNHAVTDISTSLLCMSAFTLIIPTVFHYMFRRAATGDKAVLTLSRASSVILLLVYPLYLVFQLKSHAYLYAPIVAPTVDVESLQQPGLSPIPPSIAGPDDSIGAPLQASTSVDRETVVTGPVAPRLRRQTLTDINQPSTNGMPYNDDMQRRALRNASHAVPLISRTASIIVLIASTGMIGINAELLVTSINKLAKDGPISEAFIGLIIIPIAGNAAEHITAISVAAKDNMDLAIGVSIGSSIQIGLYITPLIVIIGWILGKNMGLLFNLFETISLVATVFVVNFMVLNGRTHYLKGVLLCACYIIIGVAACLYPSPDQETSGR
ncbi:calcium/proton exchanger [Polytolypa hystricis UAMH7299]|uniref:Calcium/proton exchanger n=1 Tax=Polytolypa hystricis (strain UAMH7299) TaxID=1447883 RepID=A0A2B7Z1V3_POLH7|nr:calcium/proton exchanger [Polytolypa hystricis UAMH7299]